MSWRRRRRLRANRSLEQFCTVGRGWRAGRRDTSASVQLARGQHVADVGRANRFVRRTAVTATIAGGGAAAQIPVGRAQRGPLMMGHGGHGRSRRSGRRCSAVVGRVLDGR